MRIYTRRNLRERFDEKWRVEPNSGCWLWTHRRNPAGYGEIGVDKKKQLAHRVSWELHHGPIPAGFCVLHRCDSPPCVNYKHLFLGTHQDNVADKVAKSRQARNKGEDGGNAKLSESDVVETRRLVAAGASRGVVAVAFGVTRTHVSYISSGRTWAHLP